MMLNSEMRLNADQCWQAVLHRDSLQDGVFFYGAITTGVFCRPSCPARAPKRENVRFYSSGAEAQRDGLRACLRCHPLALESRDPAAERVRALCDYMERNAQSPLRLADLSLQARLSPYHLQRSFKAIVGVSPKQYLDNCRMNQLKQALRKPGEQITGAVYEAGYGSLSRLYEKVGTQLGMTPMEYRSGGHGVEITYAGAQTPLGLMLVGATDRGLCFVQFGESESALRGQLAAEYPKARLAPMPSPAPAGFNEWMAALNRHLQGEEPNLHLPVHVRATAFQLKVWRYLQSIPYGKVQSYQEVARGIGQPAAVRAVARACAANHVALAIPCHRVIRGTGELGGYRWGLDRKRTLIDTERATSARR